MRIGETEYQTNLIAGIRQLCSEKNGDAYRAANLRVKPTTNSNQHLLNADGHPYDVGIVLENAFFVGLELKVTESRQGKMLTFSHWGAPEEEQLRNYVSLTTCGLLPINYVYNVEYVGGELESTSGVLAGSRVAPPHLLPGKFPATSEHEYFDRWLDAWFADPMGSGATRIDYVITAGVPLIYDICLQGLPSLMWLLVMSNGEVPLCALLTNDELYELVQQSTLQWKAGKEQLQHTGRHNTLDILLGGLSTLFTQTLRDVTQLRQINEDMDDKPDYALYSKPKPC